MPKTKQEKREPITLPALKLAGMKITIKGVSPYIPSRFGEKAQKAMSDKSEGKAGERKKIYSMDDDYKECFYYNDKKQVCMPASAIKKAMVESAVYMFDRTQGGAKKVKGALQVHGDLLPLKYTKIVPFDSAVKNPNRIIRRPQIHDWETTAEITYNAQQINPEQIANLLNIAGFHIGIGAWRPQCNGGFGMFKVK
jgi:hypothetical protein